MNGGSGRAAAALIALACLTLGTARPAQAVVPTHAMLLDSVAVSVAAELFRGQTIDRSVVLLLPVPGDTAGVLAQRLLERLRSMSGDVRIRERPLSAPGAQPPTMPPGMGSAQPDAGGGSQAIELHARVDAATVAYLRRIRSFPFGVKGYERLVTMRASATMQDPRTGQVHWARSASGSLTDMVPKRDLAYVSGASEAWDPPLPRGSGFRLLEPLIVVGVVAGLVVLFYSNRN